MSGGGRTLSTDAPPPVVAKPGWTPCEPFSRGASRLSFVSGDQGGARFRIAYFRDGEDGRLVGRAWFGPGTQGPPGHAHGGSIAAVLDEAVGAAAWVAGHRAVVARLEVDFKALLPIGTDTWFETRVTGVDGRKVRIDATLTDDRGQLFAQAHALCVALTPEQIAAVVPPGTDTGAIS